MLFLAVFAGFLAENQREHFVERKREKQFIISMIEDLKTDTAKLAFIINDNKLLLNPLDSLLQYFDEIENGYDNPAMRNLSGILGFTDFHPTDRTIQQLKMAGNMRLIRNLSVSDSIMAYDAAVQDILLESSTLARRCENLNATSWRIVDFRKVENFSKAKGKRSLQSSKESFLLESDRQTLGIFFNEISNYRNVFGIINNQYVKLKEMGTNLIGFLRNVYHFKS